MGLNAKEIPIRFCRMIQVSIETSFTFMRRHPLISGVLILLLIVYLFLSYIYHFLVYLSPFLVCTAILVRIFWSSEQGQLIYIKVDEKKGEQRKFERQFTQIQSDGKRDLVLERRYSLRNATSRRRNFKDKKWDVQDIVVDEKDKVLSNITSNNSENNKVLSTITSNDSENNQELSTITSNDSENKEAKPSDYAEKLQDPDTQTLPLQSEPPTSDLVKSSDSHQQNSRIDGSGGSAMEREKSKEREGEESQEEEGEESQEEGEESQKETNKAVEWTKHDQKNLMDLGISEIERNRRLESLIARRRARQQLKLQIEKGLIDIRTVSAIQIAPLLISKINTYDSPRDYEGIDGLDIPGSAPSLLRPSRNPFDIPYDPSEEKPNLTGDSFHQEFTVSHQKEMPFCRHESFSLGPSLPFEESYPFFINGRKISDRFRRLPDKGNHDLIIEKLFSKDGDVGIGFSTGVKAPKPLLSKEERTNQEDTKHKTDMVDIKGKQEEEETAQDSKSMSDHRSESLLMENFSHGFAEDDPKISNDEKFGVSEEPEDSTALDKPKDKFLNFPITSSAAISESPFDSFASPTSKNQENMLFSERCIFHKPTCSIASDLQVEFSEVGSPTLTIDGESVVYDGDIDKDILITPGSEDLGGALFSSRVSEEDIAEVSSRSIASLIPLQQIDEEEDATDMAGDIPTHAKMNYDYNIFCNVNKDEVETEASQPSNSSDESLPQTHLIDSSVDHPPHQTQPEKPEERQNLSENSRTDSSAIDSHNSTTNEDPGPSIVHQAFIDALSVNPFSFFSPRSVLPEKILTDQASLPAFDQQIRTDVPQMNIADIVETTSTNELLPNTMPHNMQPLMVDPITQTHSGASSNSQEASCSSTMADDSNTTEKLGKKPIFDEEDGKENITLISPRNMEPTDPPENSIGKAKISGKENDAEEEKLKKGESSEDKSTSIVKHEDDIESPTSAEMKTMEDSNKKSRKGVDDEVTSSPSKVSENIGNSTATTEDATVAAELAQSEDLNPTKPDKLNGSSEKVSNVQSELKKTDPEISNKVEVKEKLKNDISSKPNKPNDSLEKVRNLQSESEKNDAEISNKEEIKEKLNNEVPSNLDKPNVSLQKVSDVQNESENNDAELSNKVEVKEKLKNDVSTKLDKPNDSLERVSYLQSEAKKNNYEISNKEETKEKLNDEVPPKPDKPNECPEKEASCSSKMKEERGDPCEVADGRAEACITSGASPVHSQLIEDNNTSIIPEYKEPANPPENSDGRSKISDQESDAATCKKEDEEKLKNGENSKDKSTSVIRQDDAMKSPPEVDNEVTSSPLKVAEKISNSTVTEDARTTPELAQEEVSNVHSKSGKNDVESSNKEEIKDKSKNEVPPKPDKGNDSSENVIVNSESKKNDAEISDKEEVKEKLDNDTPSKLDKANDNLEKEEASDFRSESKKNDAKEEIKERLKNDTPVEIEKPNASSEKVSDVHSESKKNGTEISDGEEIKEKLKNDTLLESDKPNDSSEIVSEVQSDSKKNDAENSNKEEIKEKLKNDSPSQLNKPNDSSEKVSDAHREPKEGDMTMARGNMTKVNELTRSSSTEDIEANKKEAIEQESNQNEAMASSISVGKAEDSIITSKKEPGEAVQPEK